MLDMHFHSKFSDGKSSADEILEMAQKKGIKYAFLTDHDRVSHYFLEKSGSYGIKSSESVEISACNGDSTFSLHITYYAKKISKALEEELDGVIQAKINLIKLQIKKFQECGFRVDIGAFYRFCYKIGRKKENINKYDLARYICSFDENEELIEEITKWKDFTIEQFYLEFLKRGGKYYGGYGIEIPNYEIPVSKIKKYSKIDNAIVSLAHPNFTFRKGMKQFVDNIDYYIENGGVNAIEINSKATKEMVDLIVSLAGEKGLYITFGSDNHGLGKVDKKHEDFGNLNTNLSKEFIENEFNKYKNILI